MLRTFLLCAAGAAVGLMAGPSFGQLKFVDVTDLVGLDHTFHAPLELDPPPGEATRGLGMAVGDYDGDGDWDVCLLDSFGYEIQLFRNDGGTFTNVTAESGLTFDGFASAALFTDLDNDGDSDFVIAGHNRAGWNLTPMRVFRNDGDGTFTDVTEGSGLEPLAERVGGLTVVDFNHDGLLDIYVGYWLGLPNDAPPFNYLYRNDGDFSFTDVTEAAGLRTDSSARRTWSPVFADYDLDEDLDLFAAIDFEPNYYFSHNGGAAGLPYFEDHSSIAGVQHDNPDPSGNDMGVAVGDCDNDGDLDIFTSNLTLPPPDEAFKTNALFINHLMPNPFTDEAEERGVWYTPWGWGAAFLDVDYDGDLDLYVVNGRWGIDDDPVYFDAPAQLFQNDGTCHFEDVAPQTGADHVGESRALVVFDFDGDGDDDFLMSDVEGPVTLLENQSVTTNHYLRLRLVGQSGARDAIGAKAYVATDGKVQYRELFAGSSFMAGMPYELHYGLGDATLINAVTVDWFMGGTTVLHNVPADQLLVLDELAPPPPVAHSLVIEGPSLAEPNGQATFSASAEFYYGQDGDATAQAQWSINPASAGTFIQPGVLSIHEPASDVDAIVTAALDGIVASKALTVLAEETVDESSPNVTIVTPACDSPCVSDAATVSVSGTATDDFGVALVTWETEQEAAGVCVGTNFWTCSDIPLASGENVITVSAVDGSGNEGLAQLFISYAGLSQGGDGDAFVDSGGVALNVKELLFGDSVDSLAFSVWSTTANETSYTITTDKSWIAVDPAAGQFSSVLAPGLHVVHVDRTGMPPFLELNSQIMIVPDDESLQPISLPVRAHGSKLAALADDAGDGPLPDAKPDVPDNAPDADADADVPDSSNKDSDAGAVHDPAQEDGAGSQRHDLCGAVGLLPLTLLGGLLVLCFRNRQVSCTRFRRTARSKALW